MKLTPDNLRWFRHCASYINAHRGRVMVLMVGSEAIGDGHFGDIVHDIALLHSLGVKLVVCFGARDRIESELNARNISSSFHHGRRITSGDAMTVVNRVTGALRAELEAAFSASLANSPMAGLQIKVASGNFVRAKPLGIVDGVDHGFTGSIRRVEAEGIGQLLDDGYLVLVPPVGYSATGELFNVLAEEVAAAAAVALSADKLVLFGPDSGLFDEQGELIRQCELADAERLLAGCDDHERRSSLRSLIDAASRGVARCHWISYRENGALLEELFTRDGCGTLLSAKPYEAIAKAELADIGGLLEIITPLQASGELRPRSRENLEQDIGSFRLLRRDGMVIACAALHISPESQVAEIACVATHPDYRGGDRAERLLYAIEKEARHAGVNRLYAFTTRTSHWFQERGFEPVDREELPDSLQERSDTDRNAQLLAKNLDSGLQLAGGRSG